MIKIPPRKALGPQEIKSIKEVIKFHKKNNTDPGYNGKFDYI